MTVHDLALEASHALTIGIFPADILEKVMMCLDFFSLDSDPGFLSELYIV
jgi:hypothetical protein